MNVTQEWKLVTEERKGVGPKPGYDLVVFEVVNNGLVYKEVVKDGHTLATKRSWFGPHPEFASYAVNTNKHLRFPFSGRFNHMTTSHFFDLSFTVQYCASDAQTLVVKLSDDPLKMLREEIKRVVGSSVSSLPWKSIVDSKLQDNFEALSRHVLARDMVGLTQFALEVGVDLHGIDIILDLTSEDTAPIIAKTELERSKEVAEIASDRERGELSREFDLDRDRQKVRTQKQLHENELNIIKEQGKLGEHGLRAVGEVLDNIARETRTTDGLVRNVEQINQALRRAPGDGAIDRGLGAGPSTTDKLLPLPSATVRESPLQTLLDEAFGYFDPLDPDPATRQLLSGILQWIGENYRGDEAAQDLLDQHRKTISSARSSLPGGIDGERYVWLQQLLDSRELQNRLSVKTAFRRGTSA